MKSIQFEKVSIVRMKGGKTAEEEQNRQCMWRGTVLQFGFDYMSKIHKQKKKKRKKKTGFWYLQTSDRLENACKSHYV